MRLGMRMATLALALVAMMTTGGPASATPVSQPSVVKTAIAYQPFQNGYMFWREDLDKITVVYSNILTKSNAGCSEVYRDTFEGQPY
jgi:hypothetical protein